MIVYDLQCRYEHRFEGWFEDAKTFERQRKQGLVACPVCNDTDVNRIPSTFAIKGMKGAPPPNPKGLSKAEAAVVARAVMQFVESNFDNVGTDFAKEALKIHYGVTGPRNIRGISTTQEEETLRQEGVEFFKFSPPDDPSTSNPPPSDT
jgi:hypothetical protein